MSSIGSSADIQRSSDRLRDVERDYIEERNRLLRELNDRVKESESEAAEAYHTEQDRVSDILQDYRDRQEEVSRENKDEFRRTNEETRTKTYDRYGAMRDKEMRDERERNIRAIEEKEKEVKLRMDDEVRARSSGVKKVYDYFDSRKDDQALIMNRKHASEVGDLKRVIQENADIEKRFGKGYSAGRIEAIRENEDDHTQALGFQQDAHEAEKRMYADSIDRIEDRSSRNMRAQIKHRDDQMEQIVRDMNDRQRDQVDNLRKEIAYQNGETSKSMTSEKKRLSRAMDDQATLLAEKNAEALTDQAKAHQRSMSFQKEKYTDIINHANRALIKQKVSTDVKDINPELAEAIRRKGVEAARRETESDFERLERQFQATKEAAAEKIQGLHDKMAHTDRVRNEGHTEQLTAERKRFLSEYKDMEDRNQQLNFTGDDRLRRQGESMYKQQIASLEKMDQQYAESANAQRMESESRLRQSQSDFETKEKLLSREFTQKTNEIIREYERKLADQREVYQAEASSAREDAGRLVREGERKQKLFIEELSKSYEHKIAQMEQSAKERERSLSAMHEDQIDNIRRKNAANSRSKS